MDHLFSPWRFDYVTSPKSEEGCVFCHLGQADPAADSERLVLYRAEHHFLVLNLYPYTTGHLLVVPYGHVSRLAGLPDAALAEMGRLAARVEQVLIEVYEARGINFGMNLGQCAGAGIEEHLHLHAVPRWVGDTSFITVTGQTRVLPEELRETWRKLRVHLEAMP